MYLDQKIVVVLPAYNAASTLAQTYREIPFNIVDEVILCDDDSVDDTVPKARQLGIKHIVRHDQNRGYGANQKSLYRAALDLNADIIIMLHPDYQYTPKLITAMVTMIAHRIFDVVLASRILGKGALKGGMPRYKYIANRLLTFIQNLLVNHKLSEYHTGYRAYHHSVLRSINFEQNNDDFIFDNEVLSQIIYAGYTIGEVTCPAHYFDDASSINLKRSIIYGLGVLKVSGMHFLQRLRLVSLSMYQLKEKGVISQEYHSER